MADETATAVKTTAQILGKTAAKDLLQEIFADLHPGFTDETRSLDAIFTAQSASEFLSQLTDFEKVLSASDAYETTVKKLQGQIDKAAAIENFCRKRNDNFNFRDDICNLIVPGYIPQTVREKLEDVATSWGMLLITDIDDEKSFKNVERNFLPGGKYEFMKRPEERAASDVVTMGYLQLRPKHWFEKNIDGGDDLYGPPSLVFAGAIARSDEGQGLAQGPVGSRFGQIAGSEKARIEPLIGEMEHLSMERQLVPIIRDADNHLCFFGCRTQAEDP